MTPKRRLPQQRHSVDVAAAWQLVERAQAGDTKAFGMFHDLYHDKVYQFLFYRVGRTETAQSLVVRTFKMALKEISTLTRDAGCSPLAWLLSIAHDVAGELYDLGFPGLSTLTIFPPAQTEYLVLRDMMGLSAQDAAYVINDTTSECSPLER